jgi:hypothetical protein
VHLPYFRHAEMLRPELSERIQVDERREFAPPFGFVSPESSADNSDWLSGRWMLRVHALRMLGEYSGGREYESNSTAHRTAEYRWLANDPGVQLRTHLTSIRIR